MQAEFADLRIPADSGVDGALELIRSGRELGYTVFAVEVAASRVTSAVRVRPARVEGRSFAHNAPSQPIRVPEDRVPEGTRILTRLTLEPAGPLDYDTLVRRGHAAARPPLLRTPREVTRHDGGAQQSHENASLFDVVAAQVEDFDSLSNVCKRGPVTVVCFEATSPLGFSISNTLVRGEVVGWWGLAQPLTPGTRRARARGRV